MGKSKYSTTPPCLGANHPKRDRGYRRANIMERRQQTHADHEGRTTRGLMRRFRRALYRLDESMNQRSNTEAKSLGFPHQGAREMQRRAGHGRP